MCVYACMCFALLVGSFVHMIPLDSLSLLLLERSMPGIKTTQMQCQGVWPSGYISLPEHTAWRMNGDSDGGDCLMLMPSCLVCVCMCVCVCVCD
jgi:hypothetical protein